MPMNVKAHPAVRDLREMILRMAARAEAILGMAIRALRERDAALAAGVQGEDLEIDRLDVMIDEAVLRALALQAPLAEDLRGVVAIKTMAIDLERVGDLARNIGKSAERLAERPATELTSWLEPLETEALGLLRRALDCFEAHDPAAARAVIEADDGIDALQDGIVRALIARIGEHPEIAAQAVDLILIAEALERVADHATNVAEDVILIAEARNVKHAGKLAGSRA
jgi:phosphate transport system protein